MRMVFFIQFNGIFKPYFRYNGHLTAGDKRRRRSKFVLWKRDMANGIKRSNHYVVPSPQSSHVCIQ